MQIETHPTAVSICMEAMENLISEVPQCPHSLKGRKNNLIIQRYCSHKGSDDLDDIVHIKDDIARVTRVLSGQDGPVRVVEVFTNRTTYRHTVQPVTITGCKAIVLAEHAVKTL